MSSNNFYAPKPQGQATDSTPDWLSCLSMAVQGIDPAPPCSLGRNDSLGITVTCGPGVSVSQEGCAVAESYDRDSYGPIVIEWPGNQGPVRGAGKLLEATRQSARRLRDSILTTGCIDLYLVEWAELARVVGYSARRDGRFPRFLKRTLEEWGFWTGTGTRLNSDHARSALLAALWLPWAIHHHGEGYPACFQYHEVPDEG